MAKVKSISPSRVSRYKKRAKSSGLPKGRKLSAGMVQAQLKAGLARPGDILQLQRTVGNRSVGRLLTTGRQNRPTTPQVQRIPTAAEIPAYRDKLGRMSKSVKTIRSLLADYHASQITYNKATWLSWSKAIADEWVQKHKEPSKTRTALDNFRSEADSQVKKLYSKLMQQSKLSKQGEATTGSDYLSKFKSEFGFRGRSAKEMAQPQAEYITSLMGGGARKPGPDEQKIGLMFKQIIDQNQAWQQKYQLTEAELTAIKTYTAGTYRIINSALSGDEGYLKAMMGNKELDLEGAGETKDTSDAGVAKATAEAYLHAGQIDRAIQKMLTVKPWTGTAFRGETQPIAEMERIYKNKQVKFPFYLSTSKEEGKAKKFMTDGFGNAARPLGVLWKIQVDKGADIEDISISSHEKEVLLPKFTRLEIVGRKKQKDPKGKYWVVEARQAS